ncbi:MAG: TolC family protein [Verrucomicrobiota bacterium]|nr:TolC family protein [Verrucomicrobiota bacterium]
MIFRTLSSVSLVWIGLAATALALPPYPEQSLPELDALLKGARDYAPSVVAREYGVEEAIGQEKVAAAMRRPNITFTLRAIGTYENRDDLPENKTRLAPDGNLTGRQPLYYWGRLDAYRNMGKIRREQAEVERDRAGKEALWQIRQYYLQYLLSRKSQATAMKGLELADKQLAAQEDLAQAGRSTEQRMIEVRILRQTYEERLTTAQAALLRARAALEDITGQPVDEQLGADAEIPAAAALTNAELAELRSKILAPGTESLLVEQAELSLSLEKENFRVISSRNKPAFDFITGAYQDQIDSYGSSKQAFRYYFFGGVQMTWNIFDGGETKGHKISSLARQRYNEIQINRGKSAVNRERSYLLGEVEQSMRAMQTRERSQQLQQQRVALAEKQMTRNEISSQELLRMQIQAEEAQVSLLEARVNYIVGLSKLRSELYGEPQIIRK